MTHRIVSSEAFADQWQKFIAREVRYGPTRKAPVTFLGSLAGTALFWLVMAMIIGARLP